MPRKTIVELEEQIKRLEKAVDYLQKDINDLVIEKQNILMKQNVVPKSDYDALLKQMEDLKAMYDLMIEQKEFKKHNERNAGRKRKLDVELIGKMRADGLTVKQIADKLEVGTATVNRCLKRIKIKNDSL